MMFRVTAIVSLLPGEIRTLTARRRPEDAPGATPTVAVDGWNGVPELRTL
jgi:hypothetical protein